jgi:hypothetical protein
VLRPTLVVRSLGPPSVGVLGRPHQELGLLAQMGVGGGLGLGVGVGVGVVLGVGVGILRWGRGQQVVGMLGEAVGAVEAEVEGVRRELLWEGEVVRQGKVRLWWIRREVAKMSGLAVVVLR